MRFLISCGPTYEPLDQVRRLTNFSTSKLGVEFANFLTAGKHTVVMLQGYYSTYSKPCHASQVIGFTTTGNLLLRFQELASQKFDAVFHAAAVSDFEFGAVYKRGGDGQLQPIKSGKYSTRDGKLLAELVPTPKLLPELPRIFPESKICGWKYEVDRDRESAILAGVNQVRECKTNWCVVNGPAYGSGYGIVASQGFRSDCATPELLYANLLRFVQEATS